MKKIEIKEADIDNVLEVHQYVLEMDNLHPTKSFFTNRIDGLESLITIAYFENNPVGYMISYDKSEGLERNIYCWLAGVDYRTRRKGVLTSLMQYHQEWAKERGYTKIQIKTRNDKRAMLSYLVKNDWNFTKVEEANPIKNSSIYLEKDLEK